MNNLTIFADRDRSEVISRSTRWVFSRFPPSLFSNNVQPLNVRTMAKARWQPIPGCKNYAISSHGKVKRLKHKAHSVKHCILPEKMVELCINSNGTVYVKVLNDDRKQVTISIQKLVLKTFGQSGVTYYKISDDPFNNRIDVFVPSFIYDRLSESPLIHKIIKT